MGKRLENAPAMTRRSRDNTLVHQEKQDGGGMTERHARPVVRLAEIVLEMQADVPRRLVKESREVLVIAMGAVVSKSPGPGRAKFPSEWFNHGISNPQSYRWSNATKRVVPTLLLDYYIYPDKAQVARIRHRGGSDHPAPSFVRG